VAEHLGVRASSLPCAAFFSRPDHSREVLRVRISDYLGPRAPEADDQTLTRAFRGMSAAVARCAHLDADGRIDCLRAELIREQREAFPAATPPTGDKLASAASTVDPVEKVVVGGTTIATTVLRALGIGI
jgi:hypothetical protein